jgi:predicted MFS family arabinose efflux permease
LDAADIPERSTAWYAGFTALLTVAMAIGTFPQFTLGALGPFLVDDLGLSRTRLGSLSTAFFLVAALVSSLVGYLGERLGGRRLLALMFAVAATSAVSMAIAPSFPLLIVAVGLAGLSIASSNPSTNTLISAHLPSGRRGAVVGIKQSGVQALTIGWRPSLLLIALVAAGGLAATITLLPRQEARASHGPQAVNGSNVVRWLVPYAFFMGAGVSATTAYLPLYANQALGLDQATAGSLLAVVGAVGVASRILWGRVAERRPNVAAPLTVLTAGSLVAIVLVWVAEYAGTWLVWPAAVAIGATAAAWNAVGMLAIVRETALAGTSRASGHVLTGFYAGLLAMPVAFGALVDTTGIYGPSWALTFGCLAIALGITLAWQRAGSPSSPHATSRPTSPGAS